MLTLSCHTGIACTLARALKDEGVVLAVGATQAVPPGEVQGAVVARVYVVQEVQLGGGRQGREAHACCDDCVQPPGRLIAAVAQDICPHLQSCTVPSDLPDRHRSIWCRKRKLEAHACCDDCMQPGWRPLLMQDCTPGVDGSPQQESAVPQLQCSRMAGRRDTARVPG